MRRILCLLFALTVFSAVLSAEDLRYSSVRHGKGSTFLEFPTYRSASSPDFVEMECIDCTLGPLISGRKFGHHDFRDAAGTRLGSAGMRAFDSTRGYFDINDNERQDANESLSINLLGSTRIRVDYRNAFGSTLSPGCRGFVLFDGFVKPLPGAVPQLRITANYMSAGQPNQEVRKVGNNDRLMVVPQIAMGPAGPNVEVGTCLNFGNSRNIPAKVNLFFRTHVGQEVQVRLAGNVASTHQVTVPAFGSVEWPVFSPQGNLVTGALFATSDISGVRANVIYKVSQPDSQFEEKRQVEGKQPNSHLPSPGRVLGSAGLAVPIFGTNIVISVEKDPDGTDTALSATNVTAAIATITAILRDSTGREMGTRSVTLAPGNTLPRFFNEVLGTNFTSFAGSLQLLSTSDLGVIAIRTLNGLPLFSLPTATLDLP